MQNRTKIAMWLAVIAATLLLAVILATPSKSKTDQLLIQNKLDSIAQEHRRREAAKL